MNLIKNKKFGALLRFSIICISLWSIHSYADNPFYIGGGAGVGINDFSPSFELFSIPDAEHGALGGRFFAGYSINPYLDIEAGYTHFGNYENEGSSNQFICFSSNLQQCIRNKAPFENVFSENLQVHNYIQAYAFDLTAKVNLPISKRFIIFGKIGAAYINASINSDVLIDFELFNHDIGHIEQSTYSSNSGSFWHHLNPVVGIGDEFLITDHFSFRSEYDYYSPVYLHGNVASDAGTLYPSIILGTLVFHF